MHPRDTTGGTASTQTGPERPERRHGDNLYPDSFSHKFGDVEVHIDAPAGVWNPTPHGIQLGHMLLSVDFSGKHVLELGTGCGIHAILVARQGAASMTLTEIEQAINDNAAHNLAKNGIDIPVDYHVADWTSVPGASHSGDAPWDVLVTNPPFAKSGKRYRRHFIDTLILDAHKLVRPGGELIFVQSSMADVPRSIGLMEECGMTVRILGESDGPFRDYYFEDPVFLKEMAAIPGAYAVRDGVHYERLVVFRATLPA